MTMSKSYTIFRFSPLRLAMMLVVLVLIEACAARLPEHDAKSKPMLELYKEHITSVPSFNRGLQHGTADLASYTRTAANELEVLFPLLPNPKIVLYIFPHIAEGVPVPGYATSFSLYERDHYALPVEYLE